MKKTLLILVFLISCIGYSQNPVYHPGGVRLGLLASAPSSPYEGQYYYNSTDKVLYLYDGTSWNTIGSGGGSIGGSITDNQIAVGATTSNDIEGSSDVIWDGTEFKVIGESFFANTNSGEPRGDAGFLASHDTGVAMRLFVGASNSVLRFDESANFYISSDTKANILADGNIGTKMMTFEGSSGFVGVNITDPTERLHVVGNIAVTGTVDGVDIANDVVTKVGTPVNNQIGVWTGDGTLEGDPNFTWDGTYLNIGSPVTLNNSSFDFTLQLKQDIAKIGGMDFQNINSNGEVRLMARNDVGGYVVLNSYGSTDSSTILGVNRNNTMAIFSQNTTNTDQSLAIGTFNAGDLVFGTTNLERGRFLSSGEFKIIADPTTGDHVGNQDFNDLRYITTSVTSGTSAISVTTLNADKGKTITLTSGATTITLSDDATLDTGYQVTYLNQTGGNVTWLYGTGDQDYLEGTSLVAVPDGGYAHCYYTAANTWKVTIEGSGGGGLANIVEDLTPQLGGDLDANGFTITDSNAGEDDKYFDFNGTNSWMKIGGGNVTGNDAFSLNLFTENTSQISFAKNGSSMGFVQVNDDTANDSQMVFSHNKGFEFVNAPVKARQAYNLEYTGNTNTSQSLAYQDLGKILYLDNASDITYTINDQTDLRYKVGSTITLVQKGAGQILFAGTGEILSTMTTPKSRTQYSMIQLILVDYTASNNKWQIIGDLEDN